MKALFNSVDKMKDYINSIPSLSDVKCVDVLVGSVDGGLNTLEMFFVDGKELITIELEYDQFDLEEMSEEELTTQIIGDIIYSVSLEQLNFKTLH